MGIDAPVPVISSEVKTPIVAVTELYYNACVLGNLKISSKRVTALNKDFFPGGADQVDVALPKEKATYLSIKNLKDTYLSIVFFKKTAHSRLVSRCTVATELLNLEEGYRVFTSFSKDRPLRAAPYFLNKWYLDYPKEGYRQIYSNRSRKQAIFTTEIFIQRKSQPGEKESK